LKMESFLDELNQLRNLDFDTYRKDFLLTTDKTREDIKATIKMAQLLRTLYRNNISTRFFQTGLAISIFKDKSTRTRFSFASAANLLGLTLNEFDETKTQVSHGETLRETSNMISFLSEVIGIRHDKFIGQGHQYMKTVGEALDEGFAEGVLGHRPAIVNLQCDVDHPTQTLTDILHLKRYCGGRLEDLKGKKIAMTWAYSPSYGKPLSVPQGIITLMSRFGMDVHLAHPEGYDLMDDTMDKAKQYAEESGGSFTQSNSMEAAFEDADVVYPKSWAPYSVMEEKTKLLEEENESGLEELEQQCLERNKQHIDWECNREMMDLTRDGDALYMHCLPADISGVSCEHGEVTEEVFEQARINTYYEARYKPYIIAAMIIGARFRNPISLLDYLYRKRNRRAGSFES